MLCFRDVYGSFIYSKQGLEKVEKYFNDLLNIYLMVFSY